MNETEMFGEVINNYHRDAVASFRNYKKLAERAGWKIFPKQ